MQDVASVACVYQAAIAGKVGTFISLGAL